MKNAEYGMRNREWGVRSVGVMMMMMMTGTAWGATGDAVGVTTDGKGLYEVKGGPLDQIEMCTEAYPITAYAAGHSRITDTLTVPALAPFYQLLKRPTGPAASDPKTLPGGFYLELVQIDSGAASEMADTVLLSICPYRIIIDCDGNGRLVVSPAFDVYGSSAALDAGDKVRVRRFSDVNPNTQTNYKGVALSAGTNATYSAIFPDLIGKQEAILDDAIIKCVKDESHTTYDGKTAIVTGFSAVTGQVDWTQSIMTAAIEDVFEITWTSAAEMMMGANGVNPWPTGQAPGNNVSMIEVLDAIYDTTVTGNTVKLDLIKALISANSYTNLKIVVDYSSPAWQSVAKHKVLDFPAGVEIEFYLEIYDSTELVCNGALDSTLIEMGSGVRCIDVMTGTAGAQAYFDPGERITWPVPGARSVQADVTNAGVSMISADGVALNPMFHGLSKGIDIGYELQSLGISGIMVWSLRYRTVNGGAGTVISGSGVIW